MKKEIVDPKIKEIIHNIAEDFRFSSEHEKYAQLFYAAEASGALDKTMHADMLEYIETSMKELKNDIAWKQKFLSENPEIEEERMLNTMKTIEQEYETLLTYLTMNGF
ncbi:MAG: hypothetical protein K0U47_02310 [Epsilonproteobacteria bacterium]|nr:hypothetical protein [Campylobacterota bacterium]